MCDVTSHDPNPLQRVEKQRNALTQLHAHPMATSSPLDKNAELVVEHLGFFPLSFVDDVFNAANDLIYQTTAELERFIEAEQGAGEETEQVRLGTGSK